jgi:hypothetical protein
MPGAILRRFVLGATCLLLSACAAANHGPTTSAFDGLYEGTGYSSGPGCATGFTVTPMKVDGGHVQFGSVTGWVQPDGHLQMVFGPQTFLGQFQGTHFQGTVTTPRGACWYQLQMNRVS